MVKTTTDVTRSDRLAEPVEEKLHFITLVRSAEEEQRAHLLIESLRAFGGPLCNCPVWVFLPNPERISSDLLETEGVDFFPQSFFILHPHSRQRLDLSMSRILVRWPTIP